MAGGSDVTETTTLSCVQCGKAVHLQCPKCMELKLPREGAAFWYMLKLFAISKSYKFIPKLFGLYYDVNGDLPMVEGPRGDEAVIEQPQAKKPKIDEKGGGIDFTDELKKENMSDSYSEEVVFMVR
ncbi:hypothetical protein K2173_024897 [Erythroxylum novogranatense]|uniref:Uncharacterized protein n=1 Tax=Erythroxylum novogranatense TaxID=1862640 RepID=A0AAV8UG35_9ROSI|nr:hypothetical protein K2173_024897 [Erythroxylum novogranatense]